MEFCKQKGNARRFARRIKNSRGRRSQDVQQRYLNPPSRSNALICQRIKYPQRSGDLLNLRKPIERLIPIESTT